VLRYEHGKRLLGIALGVFLHQRHVIANHVIDISPPNAKPNKKSLRKSRKLKAESRKGDEKTTGPQDDQTEHPTSNIQHPTPNLAP
jgi:hypothetical protein